MAASLGESRGAGLTSSFLLAWKGASTLGVMLPRGGSHTIDAIPCTPQRRPCDNAAPRERSSARGRVHLHRHLIHHLAPGRDLLHSLPVVVRRADLRDELHVVDGAGVVRVEELVETLQRDAVEVEIVRLEEASELLGAEPAVAVDVHRLELAPQPG